ncbi:hypothetical protein K435DRAFT_863387 [Dendrothele bispora CBS 962.96]|uniref:Uncharacterized protein n=1 Tax=Dendrothele bispora (strain CBS 962.96) TaxID=1314807 RepID=A0A4S8LPZ3_DENBC|nr:hypothetical protein K435DRAFT_863387 [Dendrothele bispora CBS 962.96]
MRFSNVSFVLSLLSCVYGQENCLSDVKSAFDEANIPADIDINFDPTALLEVSFLNLMAAISSDTVDAAGPGPFVIAAVDPDAPNPQQPAIAQVRHFLGSGITQETGGTLVNSTAAISEFMRPT